MSLISSITDAQGTSAFYIINLFEAVGKYSVEKLGFFNQFIFSDYVPFPCFFRRNSV